MSGNVVHCQREAYDIYIGRGDNPRTGRPGEWGNPYSHRRGTRRSAATGSGCRSKSAPVESPLEKLAALHGKSLGCWCAPDPCHGEVLAAAAAWAWRKLHTPQLFAAA